MIGFAVKVDLQLLYSLRDRICHLNEDVNAWVQEFDDGIATGNILAYAEDGDDVRILIVKGVSNETNRTE